MKNRDSFVLQQCAEKHFLAMYCCVSKLILKQSSNLIFVDPCNLPGALAFLVIIPFRFHGLLGIRVS